MRPIHNKHGRLTAPWISRLQKHNYSRKFAFAERTDCVLESPSEHRHSSTFEAFNGAESTVIQLAPLNRFVLDVRCTGRQAIIGKPQPFLEIVYLFIVFRTNSRILNEDGIGQSAELEHGFGMA